VKAVRARRRAGIRAVGRLRTPLQRFYAAPRWVRWPSLLALIVLLYVLPHLSVPVLNTPGTDFATVLFMPVGMYVLCSVGLDLSVGRVGIVNFGFAGFFAVGAYGMAWLSTKHGLTYYEALPVTAAMGALAAVVLGMATLRIRGDYLAIVTLAFGLIVTDIIQNSNYLGSINGLSAIPQPGPILGLNFGLFDAAPYDTLLLTIILIVVFLISRLFKSRVGRGWAAIREDEDVAELMGVPTFRFKMVALIIGGAIGGVAGCTYAAQAGFVSPDTFDVTLSVLFVACVVLGGAGNLAGVIVGAVLVAYLPERLRGFSDARVLVFAAVLTAMMILRPQGLIPRRIRGSIRPAAGAGATEALPLAGSDASAADPTAPSAEAAASSAGTLSGSGP
jgi:branched-chain amino acid transport system permease protein